nr:uncharacterized protein LOC129442817 [Misgurnus anguillicaudatus]XP_055059067.1 uncharacterized protein LOC129442817 [Misgurnus anguillicaudatus]
MGHTGALCQIKCPNELKREAIQNQNPSNGLANDSELTSSIIGPKCTAEIIIEGKPCISLLDSGSQVTTVSKSFYDTYLSSCPILSLENLIEVEGAGGQTVPYLGYIEVDMHFPEDITGKAETVTTLALVIPDYKFNLEIPVLVGTNTLDILFRSCATTRNGHTVLKGLPPYSALVQTLLRRHTIEQRNGKVGQVKLNGRQSIKIPAGQKMVLDGYVRGVSTATNASLVVEPCAHSNLPSGLLLCSYVLTSPRRTSFKVPILLQNETAHEITLPRKCCLAELYVPSVLSSLKETPVEEKESKFLPSAVVSCNAMCSTNHDNKISFDFTNSPLSEEWKNRITEKLNSISDVFATNDLDYGHTTAVKHKIRLFDPTPFKQRVRPIHPSDYEAVRLHLQELKEANIIRESESPFASPIVVVKKKNGSIRLCVDYRKLNNQTIKDAYALPNIEETFSALTGSKWFSVMDLKSGYYQVEVEEEDKHKTAFVTPMGFWEFNRLPQGVTNAPSTFQRVMEKCVGSLHLKEVLVFLDDLIVFSNSLEEHEERLMRVLNRLKEFGLKLSPDKCHFFMKSVKYLGHIVSENGVETDPDKISALTTWPKPTNIRELKSFLGFTGYYRRFVRDYSRIAKPLNALTAGYCPHRKKKDSRSPSNIDFKKPFGSRWTPECDVSFQTLIEKLTSAPVLGFANPKLPYILHTDASLQGLGAALYQEQEGHLRVIAFASRGLSNCEKRYPTHKLEFLAMKWAITEKFYDYLYGVEFVVMTDNNPLTYILTSAKLDAAGHRWLASLSNFNFSLQYRAGKKNLDADGLSRRPHPQSNADFSCEAEDDRVSQFLAQFMREGNGTSFPSEAVKAIGRRHQLHELEREEGEGDPILTAVECLAMNADAIPTEFVQADLLPGSSTLPMMSPQEWIAEQSQDPMISRVIELLKTGKRLSYRVRRREPREVQLMLRVMGQYTFIDGVLYRKRTDRGNQFHQLVLPQKFREIALEALHDSVGHMGGERTLDLVRTRFYWPRMFLDVEHKVNTCERCIRRKAKAQRAFPLVNIETSRPLELVCMDYLSLEPDGRGTKNILVITDHFTKYAVAVPTSDQKAKTVAKTLWNNFFVHYGIPERLHSDQGRDFESAVIKDLCLLLGIKKTRTTPYHPRGNPVERFNRTLLQMLGTLQEEDKVRWRDHVQPLVHAYNCTKNDTTGFSPYQLMFGRQPSLPIDVAFGIQPEGGKKVTFNEYIKKLQESLQESYKVAVEHSKKTALRNKERYDLKVRESTLRVGDRVLVKNVGIRGKHKLADKWSNTVYQVVKQINDSPVYVVKPFSANGPERTLHRDLLLPCGFLTSSNSSDEIDKPESEERIPCPGETFEMIESDFPGETVQESVLDHDAAYVDYYYPQATPDPPYPTITIIRELPYKNSTDEDTSLTTLNPNAKPFEPSENSNDVYLPEETLKKNNLFETNTENLPVERLVQKVVDADEESTENLPVEELDPKVVDADDASTGELILNSTEPVEQKQDETENRPENCETVNVDTEDENNDIPVPEVPELRRSARHREPPDRLNYKSLGSPLVLVMHSLLSGLDKAFSQALEPNDFPELRLFAPDKSIIM